MLVCVLDRMPGLRAVGDGECIAIGGARGLPEWAGLRWAVGERGCWRGRWAGAWGLTRGWAMLAGGPPLC